MALLDNRFEFRIEDNILKGKEVSYPNDFGGLGKFVLDNLQRDPDFVGQIHAMTDEEYTYGKMRERSVRCALWMRSQGLLPGDVVVICCEDSLDFAIPCFAALYLRAIFNLCDMSSNAEELLHSMNLTKPKIIFVNKDAALKVAEAAKKAKLDPEIVVFGSVSGYLEFDRIIAEPGIDEVDKFECSPIESLAEIAAIIFTSGSTGPIKCAALSHGAIMMLTRQAKDIGMPGNICLVFTAPYWIAALEKMLMPILLKMPRILFAEVTEPEICALVEKYRATWIYTTPHIIDRLVKLDSLSQYDLSSLRTILHSGIPLSRTSYEAMAKLLPKVRLLSGYGSTETCIGISQQTTWSQPGSCGEILENVQLKVIDPDTGRTLGVNEKGEILVKSAFTMSCYWGNPQATAQILDKEGWVHMGDLGYYDESGEIFVINRLKDMIRTEVYDICPCEIESVILAHPGVEDVAVVGQPCEQGDERLIAFVVRRENSSETSEEVTKSEIVDLVAAKLPESRHLSAGVLFIDGIPRTPTNKIRRAVLRNLAKSIRYYLCLQSAKSPIRSSGKIVDDSQLKIVDPVITGRILGANQRGELLIKSPYMMSFYYENPQATSQTIDSEGWLHSGDFGYYDENGEVFVIDRLKDLIKSGNCYICPSEIENAILRNSGVEEAAVVGKSRNQGNDLLIAFVIRAKDCGEILKQVTETEIVNLVAEQLSTNSREKGDIVVKFIDNIPKLPVGKIRYSALRDMAELMID